MSSCRLAQNNEETVYKMENAKLGVVPGSIDDHHSIPFPHLVEQQFGEWDRDADAAMGRKSPAHVAAVD